MYLSMRMYKELESYQIVLIYSKTGQNIDLLINKIDSMILTDKKIMETTK